MAMFSTSDKWSGRYLQRTLSDSSNKELASVFGSVLGKSSNDWRCHNCSDAFIQEQMIYPDPHRKEIFYCRPCFEVLYSQGPCHKCTKPVISDAPFVKHNDTVWHNACYVCVRCGFDDPSEIVLDPDENSLCEGCFMTGVPSVPAQPKGDPQTRVAQELVKRLPQPPRSQWEQPNERRKLTQPPVTSPELSRRNAAVDHRSPETVHQLSQYTFLRENHRPIHSGSGGTSLAPTKRAPAPKSSGSSISELRMLFSKENVDPSQKSNASHLSSKNANSMSSKWDQCSKRGVSGWESPVSQTAASKWVQPKRGGSSGWESPVTRHDQPKASMAAISSDKPRHWPTSLDKPVVNTQSSRLSEENAQTSTSWSNESKPLGNKIVTKKGESNHETSTLRGPEGAKTSANMWASPNQPVARRWECQTEAKVPEKKWEHSVEIKSSPVASVLSRWGKPEASESSVPKPEPVKKTFSYASIPSIASTGLSRHTHSPISSKAASPNLSTASSLSSSAFSKRKEQSIQEALPTPSSDSSLIPATNASVLSRSTQFDSPTSSASLAKPEHTPKNFMVKPEASPSISAKSARTPKPSVLSFISKYESMSPPDSVSKRPAQPLSSAPKRTHVFTPCASLSAPTSVQFNREKDIYNKVHEYTGKYAISPLNRLSQPRKLSDASERFKKATTADQLKGLSPSVSLGRPVTAEHKPMPSPQVQLDYSNAQTAHVKAYAKPSIANRINHLNAKVEESSAVKASQPRTGSRLSSRIQALKQHVGEGMSDVVQKSPTASTSCTSFSDSSDYFTNTHHSPGTPRNALASTPLSIVPSNGSLKKSPMVSAFSSIPSHFTHAPSPSTPLNPLPLSAPVNRSSWRQPPKRFDETLMRRTDTSRRVNEEIKRQQRSTETGTLPTPVLAASTRTLEPQLSLSVQPWCSHSLSTNRIYQDLFNEKQVKHMFCGGSSLERYDIATPSATLHTSNSNKALSTSPSVVFSTRSTPIKHLGGMIKCQGCSENATQNEVVVGPLGKRYHAKCLKCGLCSKSVDSGCRLNAKGQLRCENCRAKDTLFRRRSSAVRVMC